MAFKLHSITMTNAIGDPNGQLRYVYVDKSSGQTMSLLEPLYATDDVDALMQSTPTKAHASKGGTMHIVTTWRRPPKTR